MLTVKIKFNSEYATTPTKGEPGAAGYDLYAIEEGFINPGERVLFKTGISMEIPNGFYGRIAPRSGLAFKYGIDVLAGVIDSSYRGDIGVILYNTSKDSILKVERGDRIAQIIFEQCNDALFVNEALNESIRGEGGFGSTGI